MVLNCADSDMSGTIGMIYKHWQKLLLIFNCLIYLATMSSKCHFLQKKAQNRMIYGTADSCETHSQPKQSDV